MFVQEIIRRGTTPSKALNSKAYLSNRGKFERTGFKREGFDLTEAPMKELFF